MLAMVPSHFPEIDQIIDKILDIVNRQICLFIAQYHNIRQIRLRINGWAANGRMPVTQIEESE